MVVLVDILAVGRIAMPRCGHPLIGPVVLNHFGPWLAVWTLISEYLVRCMCTEAYEGDDQPP